MGQDVDGADLPHRAVRTVVQAGIPSDVIIGMAKELNADLVVMGTHGRHGLQHVILGSIAERVVRTAPCPVLTVRGSASQKRGG